jgi:hypothetical protein
MFTETKYTRIPFTANSLDHQRIYRFRVKVHCEELLISTTLDLDSFHVLLPVRHVGACGRGGRDQCRRRQKSLIDPVGPLGGITGALNDDGLVRTTMISRNRVWLINAFARK